MIKLRSSSRYRIHRVRSLGPFMRRFELTIFKKSICSKSVTQKHKDDLKNPQQPRIGGVISLATVEGFQKLCGSLRCRNVRVMSPSPHSAGCYPFREHHASYWCANAAIECLLQLKSHKGMIALWSAYQQKSCQAINRYIIPSTLPEHKDY